MTPTLLKLGLVSVAILTANLMFQLAPKEPLTIPDEVWAAYGEWKVSQNRLYSSPEEEAFRIKNFYQTWREVKESRKQTDYVLELNQFSDLSKEEFLAKYTNPKFDPEAYERDYNSGKVPIIKAEEELENSVNPANLEGGYIDWTQKGVNTPVKNQGDCGSCWAFSIAAAIESMYIVRGKNYGSLSPQYVLDCTAGVGCNGADIRQGWNMVRHKGIVKESEYPYRERKETCKRPNGNIRLKSYYMVGNTKNHLIAALARGPVSVTFGGYQMMSYRSGIYQGFCSLSEYHSVLLVGIGLQGSTPYWKIKNSWGASWGERGYARIALSDKCQIHHWSFQADV